MKKKKIWFWLIILLAIIIIIIGFFRANFGKNKKITYGLTFSQLFAEELGLDWQKTFLAMLDELPVKNFRLIAYWNKIEATKGEINFSDLDWQITEASNVGL